MKTKQDNQDLPSLTDAEKDKLLRIARETLVSYLSRGTTPDYLVTEPTLLEELPVFVTLRHRNGDLRGCIGRIEACAPLYLAVQDCAISSATRDYRFPPVTRLAELDDLRIEISVLSTFRRIDDPEEIQVGRHGLLIKKGLQGGLLLPQVASDRGWNRAEFLRAICMKAGLPTDAWREADLSVFGATVFEEE
jgi:AmmeMemoRadiSam system protein A